MALTGAKPGDWVLDIASNDGCLLSKFRELGMNVVGVDPAENLAREANLSGIRTLCTYWSKGTAKDIASRFSPLTIITATNVLAHVDDVHEFVEAVNQSLAPRGLFVAECPYVVDFVEKNEFDTAYHEHLSYFSVHSLTALMEQHGLRIWNVEYFKDLHGGTIRIYVCRPGGYPLDHKVQSFLHQERQFGIKAVPRYKEFAKRVEMNKHKLVGLLNQLRAEGKTIWAYGASAKGNTLMNYFGLSADVVPVAIDDNPKKWGLYTPGAHMLIVAIDRLRETSVDYLLLLAWNFKDEIMRRCQAAGYRGGFILPVPDVEVIEMAAKVERKTNSA
jgi:SAM-dependent methyltransferase